MIGRIATGEYIYLAPRNTVANKRNSLSCIVPESVRLPVRSPLFCCCLAVAVCAVAAAAFGSSTSMQLAAAAGSCC